MNLSVTIRAEIALDPDTAANVRQWADDSGMTVERFLEEEAYLWWDVFAENADDIEVELS